MSRRLAKLGLFSVLCAGVVGASLTSEVAYAQGKKHKKIAQETYALAAPLTDKESNRLRARKFADQSSVKRRLVIFGKAAWICTPSGFGRKATCAARSSFG